MGKSYSSDRRDRIVSHIRFGAIAPLCFSPYWGEPESCGEAGAARNCYGIGGPCTARPPAWRRQTRTPYGNTGEMHHFLD